MSDERLIYRRTLGDVRQWRNVSVEVLAFWLHRITGWLLLGWIGLHLAIPAITDAPTAIWFPTWKVAIVFLLSIVVFHALNGIRLMVAEMGLGAGQTRRTFQTTLLLCALVIVILGWSL